MENPSFVILAAEEQIQLEKSLALLGDSVELVAGVEKLYDALPEAHSFQSPLSHKDGVRLNMQLVCRRQFRNHWDLVQQWSEHSRYQRHGSEMAKALVEAIGGPKNGVIARIRRHW
jgi:hypothetical protein